MAAWQPLCWKHRTLQSRCIVPDTDLSLRSLRTPYKLNKLALNDIICEGMWQ
jgi:hypothetical protein